jgi:hypothetical protein
MKTNTTTAALLLLLLLAATLGACGGDSGSTDTADGASSDEYVDAVPSAQMVDLQMSESASQSQGLAVAQQALEGDRNTLRQHTQNVMAGVRELISETHQRMDNMAERVEPATIELNNLACKQWLDDGERASWRMTLCKAEARGERFTVLVEGRPLDSDGDYIRVVSGESFRIERHEGQRRSRGRLFYNLDNLATLRGGEFGGQLAIGFHAAGAGRRLHLGLRGVEGPRFEQPLSARYEFTQVQGRGGSFRFLTLHDLITAGETEEFAFGADGTPELGRAHVAWTREGAARTAAAICGGTLGRGECIRVHQCWSRQGDVDFEEVTDGEPNWEPASCAEVFEDVRNPPAEGDVDAPAESGGEPQVEIPEAPSL